MRKTSPYNKPAILCTLALACALVPRPAAAEEQAPPPAPRLTPEEVAAAGRAKQQALYELDHEEHTELAHRRHVGHLELLAGLAITVVGGGLIAISPRSSSAIALGGGLVIGGAFTLAIGGVTTARGVDPNPVVPPPPPLGAGRPAVVGAAYRWRF